MAAGGCRRARCAAQQVLQSAGVPFQSSAALPLAAEPGAASLDLLMDVALSGDTRAALIVLLRSPHVQVLRPDGTVVDAAATAALDRWLAEQRYLGSLELYPGAEVRVVERAPFAGPLSLTVNGTPRVLDHAMAARIRVE